MNSNSNPGHQGQQKTSGFCLAHARLTIGAILNSRGITSQKCEAVPTRAHISGAQTFVPLNPRLESNNESEEGELTVFRQPEFLREVLVPEAVHESQDDRLENVALHRSDLQGPDPQTSFSKVAFAHRDIDVFICPDKAFFLWRLGYSISLAVTLLLNETVHGNIFSKDLLQQRRHSQQCPKIISHNDCP